MFSRSLLIIALCILLPLPTAANLFSAPTIDGHIKTLNSWYDSPTWSQLDDGFFSANSQRLSMKTDIGDVIKAELAIDNLALYSGPPTQILLPADSPNRRLDLEHDSNHGARWSNRLSIDRLTLGGSYQDLDWSIGRQAVGFGRIVIFSPLDIIAPFPPDALDTDVRPGVDAVRTVYYFGLGGQIGGTIVFGADRDRNSYLVTFSVNKSGIDLLGIGGTLRDRGMLGLGVAGNLGTLGVKAEASYYNGKDVGQPGGDLHEDFTIGAIELWYRFNNGAVLLGQYLYNGAGAERPEEYLLAATSAPFNEGLAFLTGQQYLLLGPSWEFHPLASISGLLIRNLEDDSTLLRPQLQLSLTDNLSLDLFYSFNFGEDPQAVVPGIFIPRSEFGSAGDNGGLLLRWYF
ncbi:MAG: hypothetical protein C0623_11215 [Desulfuromonas sp.]|nr:MAG: hypothetical protein C0623_11215 [Desulfuromonas sp.]